MKRDYLSYSALKAFAKSPNHYLEYIERKFEPSPAMLLGSVVHMLILEPEKFDDTYAVAPEVNKRTKAGKEELAKFSENLGAGIQVIDASVLQEAQKIAEKAKENSVVQKILESASAFEMYVGDEINGVEFKGYADLMSRNYVYDLKTTQDASPAGFQRAAANLDYHLQATIYRELTGLPFRWIAVETSAPYNVQVYEQDEESYERSRVRLKHLVERFKAWDGEPESYTRDNILPLSLPAWAK